MSAPSLPDALQDHICKLLSPYITTLTTDPDGPNYYCTAIQHLGSTLANISNQLSVLIKSNPKCDYDLTRVSILAARHQSAPCMAILLHTVGANPEVMILARGRKLSKEGTAVYNLFDAVRKRSEEAMGQMLNRAGVEPPAKGEDTSWWGAQFGFESRDGEGVAGGGKREAEGRGSEGQEDFYIELNEENTV